MRTKINNSIWVILPSILLFLISCATPLKQLPYTPEEVRVRANLGTIGIVSACFQPEVRFQKPMTKGAAALHVAGEAALGTLYAGSSSGQGGIVLIALTPVAAAVGSIVGAVKGISTEKIKETEDALNGYLATLNFQETMRERFLSVAREQTQFPLVLIEEQGPKALDEEVIYSSLSDKDIDTILEISVRKCDLYGKKGEIDPHLRLLMAVGTRLIQLKDGKVLYNHNFIYGYEYESGFHKFSEWGVNNAQPFREELDRAFQYLAMEVMRALSNIQTPLNPQSLDVMEIE